MILRRLAMAALGCALLLAQAQAQQADPAAPAQPGWVPRGTAELQALDKVYARAATLSVKIGQSVRFGTIDIAVLGCFVRPPDRAQDAAAFLAITDHQGTDQQGGAAKFRGWMFAANPALSMLEHPIYDVRLIGCRG